MSYGFVRVGAAVPLLKVGDCTYNVEQTEQLMQLASEQCVQMLCFPEMGITGYTCGDLFHQKILVEQAENALQNLLERTSGLSLLTLVGMPVRVQNRLMNTAVAFQNGHILAVIPKTWLPNYGEFYEKRWFSSAREVQAREVTLCGQTVPFGTDILLQNGEACVGVEICEDLWMPVPPSSFHALHGANLLFNLSASNELIAKNDYRKQLVAQQSTRCIASYIYASCGFGESTTDVVFAGNAEIVENGSLLAEAERFTLQNQLVTADVDVEKLNGDRLRHTGFTADFLQERLDKEYRILPFALAELYPEMIERNFAKHPFVPSGPELDKRCQEMFSIQVQGLAKRMTHTGCQHAVIGISGGLDSTLALLVTVKTFDKLGIPRSNIEGITMPGFGTTDRTYQNAVNLINSLGVHFREISIRKAVEQHFSDIGHDSNQLDITYENSQARERTQILMDIANQVNGLVIGTGDLSELALGWATYNGDHMSMYGVNVGVPKTLVRFIVQWVSENQIDAATAVILADVVDTPVSPELLPATSDGLISQKTEDLVGPYELHDFFLYQVLRFGFQPRKIRWMAIRAFEGVYDEAVIEKWLRVFYRRFFAQQFKRSCLPDGPKVGSVSLSPRGDWRMPSDAVVRMWLEDLD
ncbi:MAG TPA: NAD(+) synthase [Bacteroidales bacterium]|nr:NAD(+) synthase [Bacteroidales bacterium]